MSSVIRNIPFEDLFLIPLRNGLTKPKGIRGKGVKMINMGELFAHSRINNVRTDRVPYTDNEKSFLLEKGDLLFARQSLVLDGAGKCSIFLGDDELVTYEGHIIRARLNPEIAEPFFYYYFFNSPIGRRTIESIIEQVAAAGIRGSDLSKLNVPFPLLPEQRLIAGILSALDDKIELNRRMNATLESIARAVFRQWFVENDETKRWEIGTLEDITDLNPEVWSNKSAPSHVEYIDLSNTKWGRIEESIIYSWGEAPSRARRILRSGDTIIGTVRPGNGSYAMITRNELTGSTGFAVLRPKKAVFREYVYLAATSKESIEWFAHLADGAAYPAIRPDVVASFEIIHPPDETFKQFSKITKPLLDKIALNDDESRTLASLRDSLLPKLMMGEVRVKGM